MKRSEEIIDWRGGVAGLTPRIVLGWAKRAKDLETKLEEMDEARDIAVKSMRTAAKQLRELI